MDSENKDSHETSSPNRSKTCTTESSVSREEFVTRAFESAFELNKRNESARIEARKDQVWKDNANVDPELRWRLTELAGLVEVHKSQLYVNDPACYRAMYASSFPPLWQFP